MPDATYVGAGMPCGNCGNPLTPGQPHKCGRTPDFDRRLDESWEPSPAASPDERLREALAFYADKGNYTAQNPVGSGAHVWRDMGGRARAALAAADREKPDERLSSVRGETFYHAVCLGCEESPDEDGAEWRATAHEAAEVAAEHGWRDGRCEECQPVADREKPEACRAPHCWSEYGTPCGSCPVAEKPETDT